MKVEPTIMIKNKIGFGTIPLNLNLVLNLNRNLNLNLTPNLFHQ